MTVNRQRLDDLKPYLSIFIIIVSLFTVVFCKMEIRRVGYSVLKLSREEKHLRDFQRQQIVMLAKITRPERVQNLAQSRLTLKKAEAGQIIQMTEQGIALKQ
jgi:cell division protein FtsL